MRLAKTMIKLPLTVNFCPPTKFYTRQPDLSEHNLRSLQSNAHKTKCKCCRYTGFS